MSDTVEVSLNSISWTLVASSGQGFVTNASRQGLFYKEALTKPADNEEGHPLRPKDYFHYSLLGGSQVWARLKSGGGKVTVTPV